MIVLMLVSIIGYVLLRSSHRNGFSSHDNIVDFELPMVPLNLAKRRRIRWGRGLIFGSPRRISLSRSTPR